MIRNFKLTMLLLITIFLVGCSVSEEEALTAAKEAAEKAFHEQPLEPSHQENGFSFHLLPEFTIDSVNDYNVLLEKGKDTFLLFVNPVEASNSKVIYETTKQKGDLLNHTFEAEDRFGFVVIRSVEEKHYEISAGIGGVKMTTKSSRKDIVENMTQMMQIVRSLELN